jgi:hypothetical protein
LRKPISEGSRRTQSLALPQEPSPDSDSPILTNEKRVRTRSALISERMKAFSSSSSYSSFYLQTSHQRNLKLLYCWTPGLGKIKNRIDKDRVHS